jgi:putative FmdB family regulatory protein
MPLYEYKCDACGIKTEELHKYDEKVTFSCEKCGETLKKYIDLGSSYFKGTQSDKTFNSNFREYGDDTVEADIGGETKNGRKRHETGLKFADDSITQSPDKIRMTEATDGGEYNGVKDYFGGVSGSYGHMGPKHYPRNQKQLDALIDKQLYTKDE